MSTFVFAPSWANYPNQPKVIKETDEFPTLINNNNPTLKKNSVWSNPHLIKKIYLTPEEEECEVVEEKSYELERLKALVPKTKKSIPNSNGTGIQYANKKKTNRPLSSSSPARIKSTLSYNPHKIETPTYPKSEIIYPKKENLPKTDTAFTCPKSETPTLSKSVVSIPSVLNQKKPIVYLSMKEQQQFYRFIQSWTSNGRIALNRSQDPTFHSKEYSYFNFKSTNNNKVISTYHKSTPIITKASITTLNSNSFFFYNPFS